MADARTLYFDRDDVLVDLYSDIERLAPDQRNAYDDLVVIDYLLAPA